MIGYCFWFLITYTVSYEDTKLAVTLNQDTFFIYDESAYTKNRDCMCLELGRL